MCGRYAGRLIGALVFAAKDREPRAGGATCRKGDCVTAGASEQKCNACVAKGRPVWVPRARSTAQALTLGLLLKPRLLSGKYSFFRIPSFWLSPLVLALTHPLIPLSGTSNHYAVQIWLHSSGLLLLR